MPDGFPNSGRREIRPRRAGRDRADPGAAMRGREWISVRRCSLDYMEVPLRKRGGMAVNPQGSKTGWAHKFLGSFAGVLVAVLMGYSSGVPVAATAAAAPPPSSSTPAPIPELSSSIAGITVTGIIGGSASVPLNEVTGQAACVDDMERLAVKLLSGGDMNAVVSVYGQL